MFILGQVHSGLFYSWNSPIVTWRNVFERKLPLRLLHKIDCYLRDRQILRRESFFYLREEILRYGRLPYNSSSLYNKGFIPHMWETEYVRLTPYWLMVCLLVSGVDLKEPICGLSWRYLSKFDELKLAYKIKANSTL